MNVFYSDLITMVPKWNYFIFMQIDYPRWLPALTEIRYILVIKIGTKKGTEKIQKSHNYLMLDWNEKILSFLPGSK